MTVQRCHGATTFCPNCARTIAYENTDVQTFESTIRSPAQMMAGARGSPRVIFAVACECSFLVEVGRKGGRDDDV